MHKILFKAKTVKHRKWVEGSLVVLDEEHMYIVPRHENASTLPVSAIIGYSAICVDTETVCQYTGLTDKNGKRIYEGDVVLYPWNYQDKTERFTIKFKDGQFVASPIKKTEDYWDFMVGGYSKEMEIIGNIHDNPELLEVHND